MDELKTKLLQLWSQDFVPNTPEDQNVFTCLTQALEGWGHTEPNPPVGALILGPGGAVRAKGYHARAGTAHAEIRALENFFGRSLEFDETGWQISRDEKAQLQDHSMTVSLEPCAFFGRTPSCAETLATLPLRKVTILARDPHPKVNGAGIATLNRAGIATELLGEQHPLRSFAQFLIEPFHTVQTTGKPILNLKMAITQDGAMTWGEHPVGQPHQITQPFTQRWTRFLRGASSACLIGKNTLVMDQARLDARETEFSSKERALFVIDRSGELKHQRNLPFFASFKPSNVHIVEKSGDYCHLLQETLTNITQLGHQSIWCEGGVATIAGLLSVAQQKQWPTRLWLAQAPFRSANDSAKFAFTSFDEVLRSLENTRSLFMGPDKIITGRISFHND